MDKERFLGCIRLISLDIVRLLIILAMIFIIGVRFTFLTVEDFADCNASAITVEDSSKDALAIIP